MLACVFSPSHLVYTPYPPHFHASHPILFHILPNLLNTTPISFCSFPPSRPPLTPVSSPIPSPPWPKIASASSPDQHPPNSTPKLVLMSPQTHPNFRPHPVYTLNFTRPPTTTSSRHEGVHILVYFSFIVYCTSSAGTHDAGVWVLRGRGEGEDWWINEGNEEMRDCGMVRRCCVEGRKEGRQDKGKDVFTAMCSCETCFKRVSLKYLQAKRRITKTNAKK